MSEQEYADLVALCQFLPGPASSQVGMAIGQNRAGILGAVAAWAGFTLPSAIILILFGLGVAKYSTNLDSGFLHSLKVMAVAIVAQATWMMGIKLCPDKERIAIALGACSLTLLFPSPWAQGLAIVLGGGIGFLLFAQGAELPPPRLQQSASKSTALLFLVAFFSLLILLPAARTFSQDQGLKYFDSFYRAGSLVFGGGHVVLPLLQAEVVPQGWVSKDVFMAGYGAAQAIPGPLFAYAAYLGAVSSLSPSGVPGALICLFAIFLPSFLLILGALPFWGELCRFPKMRSALKGVNAVVVGLLLSAFCTPVWSSGILNATDFFLAFAAFIILVFGKAPSWSVVLIGAVVGFVFL